MLFARVVFESRVREMPNPLVLVLLAVISVCYSQLSKAENYQNLLPDQSATSGEYHGKGLADLAPHDRAKALLAIGATEDAMELDPFVADSTFTRIGRAVKHGAMSVVHGAVWLITVGNVDVPIPTETPPEFAGKDEEGSGKSQKLKASEVSNDVVVGYISDSGEIAPAAEVRPDPSLRNKQLLVRVNRFYIAEYPGKPPYHLYLYVDRNKPQGFGDNKPLAQSAETTPLTPAPLMGFIAKDKRAEVGRLRGNPLFIVEMLPVEGLSSHLRIDQVSENFFHVLFRKFTYIALETSKELAEAQGVIPARWHAEQANKVLQDLDKWMSDHRARPIIDTTFSLAISGPGRLDRLRKGLYVAIQADPEGFTWAGVKYDPSKGSVNLKGAEIPFNYIIFGIDEIGSANESSANLKGIVPRSKITRVQAWAH